MAQEGPGAVVLHTSIDTQAHWAKSGWPGTLWGWVYGWKLQLMTTVASIWLPLAAELTGANEAVPRLLREMPAKVRYLLGDQHYNAPNIREPCERRNCT